jgi:hypothetical protein
VVERRDRLSVPQTLANEVEHRRLLAQRANACMTKDGSEGMAAPFRLMPYAVADMPAASLYSGAMIYVSDESGGAVLAFSDGSDWRRVTDRAIVS